MAVDLTTAAAWQTILSWYMPAGRYSCGRDPLGRPGTCGAWWHGCPKAEKRGCYLLWAKSDAVIAAVLAVAPEDWTDIPAAIPSGSGYVLKNRGLIEDREQTDGPAQWRRRPAKAKVA